jgi:hypothetical protein
MPSASLFVRGRTVQNAAFVAAGDDWSQRGAICRIRLCAARGGGVGASFVRTPGSARGTEYGFHTSHGNAIRRSRAQCVATGVTLFFCDIFFQPNPPPRSQRPQRKRQGRSGNFEFSRRTLSPLTLPSPPAKRRGEGTGATNCLAEMEIKIAAAPWAFIPPLVGAYSRLDLLKGLGGVAEAAEM